MGARRTARERALQALYQVDMAKGSADDALQSAWASEPEQGKPEPEATNFAAELVRGVMEHLQEIDALIEAHSHNWRLDRMARIDRNVLRLAIYELKYCEDVPRNVTLNEAIELGKLFGAEGSSAFINGLLDRIAAALGKA
jgi:N utilization substance protein B